MSRKSLILDTFEKVVKIESQKIGKRPREIKDILVEEWSKHGGRNE